MKLDTGLIYGINKSTYIKLEFKARITGTKINFQHTPHVGNKSSKASYGFFKNNTNRKFDK